MRLIFLRAGHDAWVVMMSVEGGRGKSNKVLRFWGSGLHRMLFTFAIIQVFLV